MSEEEINRRIAKAVEVEVEKRLAEHERVRREEREREEREREKEKERRDKEEKSRSMNRSLQEERSVGKANADVSGGASGALEDQGVGVGQTSMDDELRQRLSELEQRLYVVDLLFKAVDSGN